jgi:phosphoenolpyruvate carboxykinase (ATP)
MRIEMLFMVLPPTVYSGLLGDKITKHGVSCWLINTGWSGGPVGVGARMKIAYTWAMVKAALEGQLDGVAFDKDPAFGLDVPRECPGVPENVLNPRNTWDDPSAYGAKAEDLVGLSKEHFKQFANDVPPEIAQAGPGDRQE